MILVLLAGIVVGYGGIFWLAITEKHSPQPPPPSGSAYDCYSAPDYEDGEWR